MMMLRNTLLALLLLCLPAIASAQTADVNNPTAVVWTASTDHAQIDGYTLEILRPDGTVLQTIDAGKPTPNGQNVCRLSINVQPVQFGNGYAMRIRSRAGSAVSEWEPSQNKFNRVPGKPGTLTIEAQ